MTRIINGVAIADDYEHIVGPIEGYERPTLIEAKYLPGPTKPSRAKHAAETPVDAKAVKPKVTEVDG